MYSTHQIIADVVVLRAEFPTISVLLDQQGAELVKPARTSVFLGHDKSAEYQPLTNTPIGHIRLTQSG